MTPFIAKLFKNRRWLVFIPVFLIAIQSLLLSAGMVPRAKENELFGFLHEILLIPVGFYFFFYGFSVIRKKMLIQNTPTSKIRSVAMGLNEVVGFAKEKYPLVSPLTGSKCVYYRFKIEKETRNSKGGRTWHVVREGCSTNYFYIEDDTGRLLVDPMDSDPMLVMDYQNTEPASSILGPRIRHTEWLIKADDYVYILGTVRKFKDNIQEHKDKLVDKLRQLKEDKERLKAFDSDGDGQISIEEWDKAREKIEAELLEEEMRQPKEAEDDLVIAKGESEKTYILSDRDEQDVTRKLTYKSVGGVLGGGSLIIVMFGSLISRIGLLPAYLKIPWEVFYK